MHYKFNYQQLIATCLMGVATIGGLSTTPITITANPISKHTITRVSANKNALLKTIRRAQGVNPNHYTWASCKTLQQVLAPVVNSIYHNPLVNQAQINNANQWLNQALNHLKVNQHSRPVNKRALLLVIQRARTIPTYKFSTTRLNKVHNVLAQVLITYHNGYAMQYQVNNAFMWLYTTIQKYTPVRF